MMKKLLAALLVLCMVLTLLPVSALAAGAEESAAPESGVVFRQIEKPEGFVTPKQETSMTNAKLEAEPYAADQQVRIIVTLEGESLVDQGYTVQEIAENSEAVRLAASKLQRQQAAVTQGIRASVWEAQSAVQTPAGESADLLSVLDSVRVRYNYHVLLNGMAVEAPYGMLGAIRNTEGVKSAVVATRYNVPEDMTVGTAQPSMYMTQDTFGAARAWQDAGYTGKNMKIAIVDTGLDMDHPSFSTDNFVPGDAAMTKGGITDAVLQNLNAYYYYAYYAGELLTAADVYKNAKVPYAFDYVNGDTDVNHDEGLSDHGTHVAGIAAANKGEADSDGAYHGATGNDVIGVAPDAQLLVMKVFGENGGAWSDDIVAAVEDALILGADAINLSLGSDGGFDADNDEVYGEVFSTLLTTGVILSASAGNATTAAYQNPRGTNTNLTTDPDNGIVGSPATYVGATSVASVDNGAQMTELFFRVNGTAILYNDSSESYGNAPFTSLAEATAKSYPYVIVPGVGSADDFAQVDVTGKIAVVKRGELNFSLKQQNATDAGAVACIIYDNVEGPLGGMVGVEGVVPSIMITLHDGQLMIDAAAQKKVSGKTQYEGTLTMPCIGETEKFSVSTGSRLSEFSSWGVTESLVLNPDVAAPGGYIYSAYNGGTYGMMSGTSMAAPHIAGMAALVLQYLKDKYPDQEGSWYHTVAEALIMSTATPATERSSALDEGVYNIWYSPRGQGAGVADVYKAVTSPVYLTVDGSTPKVSLKDDPSKTGKYSFTFTLNNLTDDPVTYDLDAQVLTDWVDTSYGQYGLFFMGQMSLPLDAAVTFTVGEGDEAQEVYWVTVPASGTLDVHVDIQLTEDDADYIEYFYKKGIYVDGFIRAYEPQSEDLAKYDLTGDYVVDTDDVQLLLDVVNGLEEMPETEADFAALAAPADKLDTADVQALLELLNQSEADAVDLSLPFLAFYGDWTAARVFDEIMWYDPDAQERCERYPNIPWTNFNGQTSAGTPGNPYLFEEEYDPAHNVLSPNGDGTLDYIDDYYVGMMRGARKLSFTWSKWDADAQDYVPIHVYDPMEDEDKADLAAEYVRKSSYNYSYGVMLPFIYSWYLAVETDTYPKYETYIFDEADMRTAGLDDGDDLLLTISAYLDYNYDEADDDNNEPAEQMFIPFHLDNTAPTLTYEKLELGNTGARLMKITAADNYDVAAVIAVNDMGELIDIVAVPDTTATDDGVEGTIYLDVGSYPSSFILVVGDYGGNESYYSVSFPGGSLDTESFYAYRWSSYASSPYYGNYATYDSQGWYSFTDPGSMLMVGDAGDSPVTAAEYVDGYVIGVDADNYLFAMAADSWTRNYFIDLSDYPTILDMAFDPTSGLLFLLTDEEEDVPQLLIALDPLWMGFYGLSRGGLVGVGPISGLTDDDDDAVVTHQLLSLACDNSGELYAVDFKVVPGETPEVGPAPLVAAESSLYTLDVGPDEEETSDWSLTVTAEAVGATGVTPGCDSDGAGYLQSMTVDHASDTLYWAAYTSANTDNYAGALLPEYFYEVDKETGAAVASSKLQMESASELVGLFKPSADVGVFSDYTSYLFGLDIEPESALMLPGMETLASVLPYPYFADVDGVVWASSDAAVATVDDGLITARSAGTATITATVGNVVGSCTVTVVDPEASLVSYNAEAEAWLDVPAGAPETAAILEDGTTLGQDGYFIAAAYADGSVYAFDGTGGFLKLDPATMAGTQLGSNPSVNGQNSIVWALAFDPADGHLYGAYWGLDAGGDLEYCLVRVDPTSGALEKVYTFDPENGPYVTNLAVDGTGTFYTVTEGCVLSFTLDENDDLADAAVTPLSGFEGYWDAYGDVHITWSYDDDCLYLTDTADVLHLYKPTTGDILALGFVGGRGSSGDCCILEVPKTSVPVTYAEMESAQVPETLMIGVGGTASVVPSITPWNSRPTVSYASNKTAVATVDAAGTVTGVAEGTAAVTVTVNGTAYPVTVTVVDTDVTLGGYMVNDMDWGGGYWLTFPANDLVTPEKTTSINTAEDGNNEPAWLIYAAACYDDTVYAVAQDQTGAYNYKFSLVTTTPGAKAADFTRVASVHADVQDMAVDHTTGVLYALADNGAGSRIYQVNATTGAFVPVLDTQDMLVALTVDDTGAMWAISAAGDLCTVAANGTVTRVGATGVTATDSCQSLHYDSKTGNLFWAQAGQDLSNGLYLVDCSTGKAVRLGSVAGGVVLTGLYTVYEEDDAEPAAPTSLAAADVAVSPAKAALLVGETVSLTANVLPLSLTATLTGGDVAWSSSDTGVATVDESGVVTGVAAGTATITATLENDKTSSCTVTVLAEARKLYAYDEANCQWISFTMDAVETAAEDETETEDETEDEAEDETEDEAEAAPAETVTVVASEADGVSPIVAAALVGDTLYAYDKAGVFYSIDIDGSFARTRITPAAPETSEEDAEGEDAPETGDGTTRQTLTVQTLSAAGDTLTAEYAYQVVQLSLDTVTDKLYALVMCEDTDEDGFTYLFSAIGEVDVTTGGIQLCWSGLEAGSSVWAGNLYVHGGQAWMVDAMSSGMVNYLPALTTDAKPIQIARLTGEYLPYGEWNGGRSLLEDPLTGTFYMIRDLSDPSYQTPAPSLYTVTLADGDLTLVKELTAGAWISSLFIR